MPERTKRRGNYAKLICLQCRDRRIKCMLPDDGIDVQPSSQPQPASSSCQRCRHKGLECIVRKTTLGRPNRKWPDSNTTPAGVTIPTPPTSTTNTLPDGRQRSESPSPYIDDFVMCNPEDDPREPPRDRSPDVYRERSCSLDGRPTGSTLANAMDLTLDRTLALLGHDAHFGRDIIELETKQAPSILDVIDGELLTSLDPHLVWVRMYLPHIPSLSVLHRAIERSDLDHGTTTSATALLATLCSIALDAPVDLPASMRQIQDSLNAITYHFGRDMLFTLPRHEYTLMFLEIIHTHRPLALMSGREPAAHALTGKLYTTLGKTLAQQLNLQHAAFRLRDLVDGRAVGGDGRNLVYDALQWAWWLMSEARVGGDLRVSNPAVSEPDVALEQTLSAVAEAFDRGIAPVEALMAFHDLRHMADDLYVARNLTTDWSNLEALKTHLGTREQFLERRHAHFDNRLQTYLHQKQTTLQHASALSQLHNMRLNIGRPDSVGLGLFYAVMSGTTTTNATTNNNGTRNPPPPPTGPFGRYFVQCLSQHSPYDDRSPVGSFLEQFGDAHTDALERRLAAFISVASEVELSGTPFMAPPRKMCCNVVFACKEIVENSAIRLRLSMELHHRIDVHLILFMEAARCLENMESNGGTPPAISRGSILAAGAKLVRSLHRIMLQWKRNHVSKENKVISTTPSSSVPPMPTPTTMQGAAAGLGGVASALQSDGQTQQNQPSALDWDSLLNDDLFADWENWAGINGAAGDVAGFQLGGELGMPGMP